MAGGKTKQKHLVLAEPGLGLAMPYSMPSH